MFLLPKVSDAYNSALSSCSSNLQGHQLESLAARRQTPVHVLALCPRARVGFFFPQFTGKALMILWGGGWFLIPLHFHLLVKKQKD